MSPLTPYDFADRLNSNIKLREEFVSKYVDLLVDSMDHDDLIASLKDCMKLEYNTDLRKHGADVLVEQVGFEYPDLLTNEYDVDLSLLENA